jgi:cell wall-associated NlpC family hydrolase
MGSHLLLAAAGDEAVQRGAGAGLADDLLWYADLTVGGMRFVNKQTGKALQLTGDADAYGITLAAPSDATKQAFVPEETALFDDGHYRIDCKTGGASLEIEDASFWALADIRTGKADGSGTQAWHVRDNGDGTFTLKNQRSGKPAEAAAGRIGANVRQNKTSGGDAQGWILEECGGGWYRIASASVAGGYLGAGAKDASGDADVSVADASGGDAVMWRFVPVTLKKAGPAMPKAAADAVVKEARKHLGKKYVFGAEGPDAFDCSGYVYYVMNRSGVKEMSRVTAQDIYDSCVKISAKSARRGDLIFFTKTYKAGRPVTHLGIYLGNGKMIHAGSPVQISKVTTKYFKAHFYAYGRFA